MRLEIKHKYVGGVKVTTYHSNKDDLHLKMKFIDESNLLYKYAGQWLGVIKEHSDNKTSFESFDKSWSETIELTA